MTKQKKTIKLEDFRKNLCHYDLRNPDGIVNSLSEDEMKEFGNHSKTDCNCDNCFYGRTYLAEQFMKYIK